MSKAVRGKNYYLDLKKKADTVIFDWLNDLTKGDYSPETVKILTAGLYLEKINKDLVTLINNEVEAGQAASNEMLIHLIKTTAEIDRIRKGNVASDKKVIIEQLNETQTVPVESKQADDSQENKTSNQDKDSEKDELAFPKTNRSAFSNYGTKSK